LLPLGIAVMAGLMPLCITLITGEEAPTEKVARGSRLGAQKRSFTAYDCSSPVSKEVFDTGAVHECLDDDVPTEQHNKTWLVLKKVDYTRTTAKKCEMEFTRLGHYCGVYDHQTFVGDRKSVV
jgi:hypothetical protein